jgi:hypothetical protein
MSNPQMKKALMAKIVALGICSTTLLARSYVKKLTSDQIKALVNQLVGSKIEKAILVATLTHDGGTHA